MPFGLQPIHLIIVAIAALLIFGPRKLPELGRSIGRAITEFRKGTQEMTTEFRNGLNENTAVSEPGIPSIPANDSMEPPVISAEQVTGNFCSNCGTRNSPDAHFCNKCGTMLPSTVIQN